MQAITIVQRSFRKYNPVVEMAYFGFGAVRLVASISCYMAGAFRSGQVRSGAFRCVQVRSGQVRSGQVRSGQFVLGHLLRGSYCLTEVNIRLEACINCYMACACVQLVREGSSSVWAIAGSDMVGRGDSVIAQ